jgi:isocitrate dehydrogenase (NAD+)
MITVSLIEGDGIGPEITAATLRALAAAGARIEWERVAAGMAAIDSDKDPLPQRTLDAIARNQVALKGPLATPSGGGYRSVNVALRQHFDLYANVRPAVTMAGVPSRFSGVDIIVVRENTEDLYAGIEHFVGPGRSAAESIAIITRPGSRRIAEYAFDLARARGRKRVTIVHKANILKMTNGLFLEVGREVARGYPDIACDDLIVDACAMKLVTQPERFDVIVTMNLFGDILSDLTAGLVGGLGLVPGANIGDQAAIFEAVHGTAPDIAGQGLANPTAVMLAGAMLLDRIGQRERARRLESAVRAAIAGGKETTPDIGGTGTTRTFTDRVIAALGA